MANPGTGHPPNTTTSGLVKNSFYSGVGTSSSIGKKSRAKGLYGGAYAYPLYVPNYYDSSNYVDPQESFAGSNAPDRPSVVIQNFYPSGNATQQQPDTESRLETYRAPSREPVMESPADTAVKQGNYYLIAYKDHHVYSALAYWIEGETFHYVTTENTHNQAALSAIDQEMTKRLNQDRNMTFSAGQ